MWTFAFSFLFTDVFFANRNTASVWPTLTLRFFWTGEAVHENLRLAKKRSVRTVVVVRFMELQTQQMKNPEGRHNQTFRARILFSCALLQSRRAPYSFFIDSVFGFLASRLLSSTLLTRLLRLFSRLAFIPKTVVGLYALLKLAKTVWRSASTVRSLLVVARCYAPYHVALVLTAFHLSISLAVSVRSFNKYQCLIPSPRMALR